VAGFEKLVEGDPLNTGVSTSGSVVLAPAFSDVTTLPGGPLLALVCDTRGTCYAGQGAPGKVVSVDAAGKTRTLMEPPEGVVTALAVDGKDSLFVATAPTGKVFRVDLKSGTNEPWYAPEAKQIWALAHDGQNLWVATGDPGALFKVTAKDKATRVGEKPLAEKLLRSLAVLPGGKGIVVGGGRKGGIFSVDPKGALFALYDSSLEEVTSIAVRGDGAIAASLVAQDAKGDGDDELLEASDAGNDEDGNARDTKASEVVVILPGGEARKIWRGKKDGAYAVAFDDRGAVLVGTGGRGRVYRVELESRRITLLNQMESNRITALAQTPRGILVGMSHATRLGRLQSGLAREGSYLTPVLDAEKSVRLGRLDARGELAAGTKITLQVRTGNTEKPDDTWSAWSAPVAFPGGPMQAGRARFSQLKATLSGEGKSSPELRELHLTYRGENNPPQIQSVDVLAPGVRVEAMPNDEPKGRTFTVTKRAFEDYELKPFHSPAPPEPAARAKQTYEAGWRTVAWHATDEDEDELRYSAELLTDAGTRMWPLASGLRDPFVSFDESRLPDGNYRVRVSADDAPANAGKENLRTEHVSSTFAVDRTPPTLQGTVKGLLVSLSAEDLSPIIRAECTVDGGEPLGGAPADGLLDGVKEDVLITLPRLDKGRHVVACRAEDAMGNVGRVVLQADAP